MLGILIALLILNGVIIFHEYGHYIAAKKCGVNVVEFSVGFGPRIISYMKNGTRFSLKLLLFGGSCVMDGEYDLSAKKGSFNNASVGQRAAIVAAGPFFNILLAFITFVCISSFYGIDTPYITEIDHNSIAYKEGLRKGDIISKYNNHTIVSTRAYDFNYATRGNKQAKNHLEFIRDGEKHKITYEPDIKNRPKTGIQILKDTREVYVMEKDSPGEKSGLLRGDVVVSVNGKETLDYNAFLKEWNNYIENGDSNLHLVVKRGNKHKNITVKPTFEKSSVNGFDLNVNRERIPMSRIFKVSIYELKNCTEIIFGSFKDLFKGRVSNEDLSGPLGTVDVMSGVYNRISSNQSFEYIKLTLIMIAIISMSLGIVNLVPFPALDGFQLVLFLLEKIGGRPLDKKAQTILNITGFFMLMFLMILFTIKDIIQLGH